MTPTIDYSKIYTDAPQQHPNLILGSLQLLFWLFFRPTALRNHLVNIDPALDPDSYNPLDWRNQKLWQLLIQGFIVLPILTNLTRSVVLWGWGESAESIAVRVVGRAVFSVVVSVLVGVVVSVAWALVFSVVWDVAWGVGCGVNLGVTFGMAAGVAAGIVFDMAWNMAWGVAVGVVFGVALSLVFGTVGGVVLGILGSVVFGMVGNLVFGMVWGVMFISIMGTTINLWRPVVLYPFLTIWNTLLYLLDKALTGTDPSRLRYHSAFWDEWQFLPLIGLDKHLILVAERNAVEGQAAIDYLSHSRHWAIPGAQKVVQIELDARSLERCNDIEAIRDIHQKLIVGELKSPVTALLNIFTRISGDVDAALNQQSSYNQRLALRAVVDSLDAQLQNLARTSNKYAPRFYPIAQSWRQIIGNYKEVLAKATELRKEIDSPYITGVPLTLEQAIFTGRNHIGTRIEQLILDRRRPPLLLYGQRRMGKTSLLNNLGRLLPNSIIPMFVDLQGAPSSASDNAGFLYNLARGMITSAKRQSALTLPSLTREDLEKDPFTCFNEWLDKVEEALQDNTALLSLDEFEVLDSAISKGRFDEQDVLGMLRNLIQHRPKFKILIAGSHTIEEYQRWASYLINVQVVHISYLKEDEARQLIERPVKDFTLRYEPEAVERVLQLTRCHPFLVQLLCGEIVVLKNEQDPSVRRLATLADVEAAVPEALSSSGFFFADIQNNQVDAAGLAILKYLAAQGEGAIFNKITILKKLPDVSESAFKLLLQREFIEEVEDGFRFQVELIRRWFAQI
ncbi:AAA family ATPase [Brasilonema sp. UFV-L1]|uniref:AAA family ATPase n=1 Tax=Brasilonema sp. UFV-L1 TaxID=2234130 RepID=UPI00145C8C4F|nr:AAA family ATPase [Brasilonema sp. UFV-L1]NMG07401.1 ATP-binding protein [Brasilonema sp. UFV-L1]